MATATDTPRDGDERENHQEGDGDVSKTTATGLQAGLFDQQFGPIGPNCGHRLSNRCHRHLSSSSPADSIVLL
jgi:hypothetical protein